METIKLGIYFLALISLVIYTKGEECDITHVCNYFANCTFYLNPSDSCAGEKYLYLSFDFSYLSSFFEDSEKKNIAYFTFTKFTGELNFGFVEKEWDNIESTSEIENINWKPINSGDKFSDYCFKIKREDDKMNTLLFRIPRKGINLETFICENIQSSQSCINNEENEEDDDDGDDGNDIN